MKRLTILIISAITIGVMPLIAQVTWSIGAGYDQTIVQGYNYSNYLMEGFHIGPEMRYDFFRGKGFGLQTAIYYRYAARFYRNADEQIYWVEAPSEGWPIKYGITPKRDFFHYVNIPLHVTYTRKFYNDWTFTAYTGPAIDWAFMDGNSEDRVNYFANNTEQQGSGYSIGFPGPFNIAWDFGLGFSYKHLQVKASYGVGCLKEEKAWDQNWNTVAWVRPHRISCTVSYQF